MQNLDKTNGSEISMAWAQNNMVSAAVTGHHQQILLNLAAKTLPLSCSSGSSHQPIAIASWLISQYHAHVLEF